MQQTMTEPHSTEPTQEASVPPLRGQARPRLWTVTLLLLLFTGETLLLAGCNLFRDERAPDILTYLPQEWTVVNRRNPWTTINIDDDPSSEFLLLYTYNNSSGDTSGPTGGMVYDPQEVLPTDAQLTTAQQPFQPTGAYKPYRLLPNYWEGSDDGFIAPAGQSDQLSVHVVTRLDEAEGAQADVPDELLIFGGRTTITAVWWRNVDLGYGATQVYAPGTLRDYVWVDGGRENRNPLASFNAYAPLGDRSQLCHRLHYRRILNPARDNGYVVHRPAVQYVSSSDGIVFCTPGVHDQPFYPEAVVMAYLKQPGVRAAFLHPDADTDRLDILLQDHFDDRVTGLFAPRRVRHNPAIVGQELVVCVELADAETGLASAFNFVLIHQAPSLEGRTGDRLLIGTVLDNADTSTGVTVRCPQGVLDGTPGRVDES